MSEGTWPKKVCCVCYSSYQEEEMASEAVCKKCDHDLTVAGNKIRNPGGQVMSESIKVPRFRGKRVDGKGWVEGLYFTSISKMEGVKDQTFHFILPEGSRYLNQGDLENAAIWVNPSSLGMSTGLFDKNGVKIFGSLEGTRGGDRVKFHDTDGSEMVGEVEMFRYAWGIMSENEWSSFVHQVQHDGSAWHEILGAAYDLEGKNA